MKIVKSKTYFKNLKEIFKITDEKWGLSQARKYTAGIQEAVILAAKKEKIWRKYLHYGEITERTIYYISYQKHFVFFEIEEDKDLMLVLAVLHSATNIPDRLKDL